jgi:hypothetical protein
VSALTNNGEPPSKAKQALMRVGAVVATIAAVGLATAIAYLIFEGIRQTRFDNVIGAFASSVRSAVRAVVNMDPVAAAWIFPLVLGGLAVVGMLVWRRFNR